MNNLTYEQLAAIDRYKAKLDDINDPKVLRQWALANYRQNLIMHNTYHNIINHHLMIESEYVRSIAE